MSTRLHALFFLFSNSLLYFLSLVHLLGSWPPFNLSFPCLPSSLLLPCLFPSPPSCFLPFTLHRFSPIVFLLSFISVSYPLFPDTFLYLSFSSDQFLLSAFLLIFSHLFSLVFLFSSWFLPPCPFLLTSSVPSSSVFYVLVISLLFSVSAALFVKLFSTPTRFLSGVSVHVGRRLVCMLEACCVLRVRCHVLYVAKLPFGWCVGG